MPRAACTAALQSRYYIDDRKLRKRWAAKGQGKDVIRKTVWYSCLSCRTRQSVALHSPLFDGFVGRRSLGVSYAVLAFWMWVEGASQTLTVRTLRVNEKVVSAYCLCACEVMAWAALRMQDRIVWGTGTATTVEVELDASVFSKWKTVHGNTSLYSYYCWMGARQRGRAAAIV